MQTNSLSALDVEGIKKLKNSCIRNVQLLKCRSFVNASVALPNAAIADTQLRKEGNSATNRRTSVNTRLI